MVIDMRQLFECTGYKETFEYLIQANNDLEFANVGIVFPISVSGTVRNCAGVVTLEAGLKYTLDKNCDRCLCSVKLNQNVSVKHTLVKSLAGDESVSDEYIVIDADQFDLDDLFSGEVLLALPSKILCKDDCKGLCTVCGHDLNQGECGCDRRILDPRLEVLRNLLKD